MHDRVQTLTDGAPATVDGGRFDSPESINYWQKRASFSSLLPRTHALIKESAVKNRGYSAVQCAQQHPSTNRVPNNSLSTGSPPQQDPSPDCNTARPDHAHLSVPDSTAATCFVQPSKRPRLNVDNYRGKDADGDTIPQLDPTAAMQPSAQQSLQRAASNYSPLPPTGSSSPPASLPDVLDVSLYDETAATQMMAGIAVAQALYDRDRQHLQMLQSRVLLTVKAEQVDPTPTSVKAAGQATSKACEQEVTGVAEAVNQLQEAYGTREDRNQLHTSQKLTQNSQKPPALIKTVVATKPTPAAIPSLPWTARAPQGNDSRHQVVYGDVTLANGNTPLHFDHAKQLLIDASTRAAGERPSYLLQVRSREEIRGAVFKEATQVKRPSNSDLWVFKGKSIFVVLCKSV